LAHPEYIFILQQISIAGID